MGRYNFNVFKGRFAEMFHFDKAEVGVIATAGFWTYALSVMLNGPLADRERVGPRSEEHTSELQSLRHLVCRLLLEKKKNTKTTSSPKQASSSTSTTPARTPAGSTALSHAAADAPQTYRNSMDHSNTLQPLTQPPRN